MALAAALAVCAQYNLAFGIPLAGGIAAIWIALQPKGRIQRQREMANRLSRARDFESAKQFLGCDGKSGVAVDRARKRICLLTNDGKSVTSYIVSYRDILGSELIENGRAVISTMREPNAANRVDAGARRDCSEQILARLTGEKTTPSIVWQIDLRIIIRHPSKQPHDIVFLGSEVSSGGIAYGTKNHMALGWHRMFDGFMRRAELEELRAREHVSGRVLRQHRA